MSKNWRLLQRSDDLVWLEFIELNYPYLLTTGLRIHRFKLLDLERHIFNDRHNELRKRRSYKRKL